jgi:hypothetical protein
VSLSLLEQQEMQFFKIMLPMFTHTLTIFPSVQSQKMKNGIPAFLTAVRQALE